MIEGVVQETTAVPGILMQPPPSRAARGRDRDFLFVHLSLSGRADETAVVAQDLLDAISRRFYQTSGSVTAALRQAIMDANQLLLRLNLSGTQPTREGAITCAALRQGELYTLQAGETFALIGHNYGIERMPAKQPDRATPLGRSSGLDIRYNHHRLQVGDTMLLADPRIAHLPTSTFQNALVDTPVETGIEELVDIVAEDSARLLFIEFVDDQETVAMPELSRSAAPTSEPMAVIPQPRRESRSLPTIPEDARRPQPVRESTKPTIDVETTARQATSQAAMGLSRLTAWLAAVIGKLRTTQEGDEPISNWATPLMVAILVPVIVGSIVTSVYLQRGQVTRLSDVKREMALNLGLAEQTTNEAEARNHYDLVLALAEEAETELRPGDTEVARLRAEARAALDELDDITRLTGDVLYTYTEGTLLTAVILQEDFLGNLYTLDQANGYIYLHQLGELLTPTSSDPQRLPYVNGQVLGTHVVNGIVDIMWRPVGSSVSREGLAMLDSGGALLTYHPDFGDTHTAPLGLASEWQGPSAMTTYNERIYILDSASGSIWKYFPSGDQFDVKAEERTIVIDDELNLGQAADISIYNEDGSLVVAYQDGRLRYYDTRANRRQWDEITLIQEGGLKSALGQLSAVHVVGRGLNTSIFVADTANGRILQLNRGGRVLAQFQATGPNGEELFQGISDFAVAENPLRIFAVNGDKLIAATQE
ncbi:MAG: hypothetical protein DWQ04_03745 [Chloroflexi bacterium]|nr:MAG: hypothetical protein DWQ04_03745 [Chloroflexota bacterium]